MAMSRERRQKIALRWIRDQLTASAAEAPDLRQKLRAAVARARKHGVRIPVQTTGVLHLPSVSCPVRSGQIVLRSDCVDEKNPSIHFWLPEQKRKK